MFKSFLVAVLLCFIMLIQAFAQSSTQSPILTYSYHPPSSDKESWQRLYLMLSATFIVAVKEGQIELDSSLFIASRSLGLSRFSILAEGIDDPEMLAHAQWIDRRDPGTAIRQLSNTKGKKQLQELVLLGAYYAFQPRSYYRYKDSVEYFLNKAVDQSKILKEERLGRQALCLLGKIYVQGNDKKSDPVFNTLINHCKETGDKETEARALAYRGIYTPVTPGTILTKITDLQKAASLYHQLRNTEAEINVMTDIGYFLIITGQLQLARDAFLNALRLAESIQYPYIHYNTDALSMVTIFEGKFGEPLKYALQTIKVAVRNRDSIGWAYFYSRLSTLYKTEGREKESLGMSVKAVDRFVIDRDPAVYNILKNILSDMDLEGRSTAALDLTKNISKKVRAPVTFTEQYFYHSAFTQCYTSVGMLDSAEIHLAKMDSVETKAEHFRGSLRRGEINDQHAIILFRRGEYLKAREKLVKHFTEFSPTQRSLSWDLQTYRLLLMVDSIIGDTKSEIAHYKSYTQLLDSSFRVTKIRQAEELQVLYQTEEKENQIIVLNQQATIKQANLKQANLIRNVTIAGIIAALIIAALLLRQSRLTKKSNDEITEKNNVLQHYLIEKEWLLKEIHHRVKNNFQIVMGLLGTQSGYLKNEAAVKAISDSQDRIHAMSLIHQRLYQTENLSSVNAKDYVFELVDHLRDSYNSENKVLFELQIEPIELDLAHCIPLGLILNEAITNSFKYAFPKGRSGIISVSLKHTSPHQMLLTIDDNGTGLPAGFNWVIADSMGMNLMRGLSREISAKTMITSDGGTKVSVSFEYEPEAIPGMSTKTAANTAVL